MRSVPMSCHNGLVFFKPQVFEHSLRHDDHLFIGDGFSPQLVGILPQLVYGFPLRITHVIRIPTNDEVIEGLLAACAL